MFAGVAINGYLLNNLYGNPDILDPANSLQLTTANDRDYLTTRVSYKLNLTGPSVNLQTACSTSLVAVHTACQSLQTYQCDIALAGGIAVRIPQKGGYWYQEGGITSPDGHCRAFDARAQGTIFGSGVGVVVLKRLADALADGDAVLAIIRGSAVNNDGAHKVGFTAPSVDGQTAVVAMAQGVSGVDPETITFMEAHGTGTNLGDPIEITALNQVFRTSTQKKGFCAIGSVKTNIGHASAAAGIAGLIKAVLALQHRQIPPSLHYETPNPKIDFANSPFYVNTTLADWPANGTPRRAGVSSFGVGGTNAHLVLEEAPEPMPTPATRPWHLLVLSAKTEFALESATANLAAHLRERPDLSLADIAYTLQVGRRSFNHRRMLVCRDRDDALAALEARDPRRVLTLAREPRESQVAFLFSGQGAQYVDMARELYDAEPVFRETVDRCAGLLRPHLGLDIRELIYPTEQSTDHRDPVRRPLRGRPTDESGEKEKNDRPTDEPGEEQNGQSPISNLQSPINQTHYTQPALFAVEYALAQLWMSWGVQPQAMIGHSVGEYVAACLAGVFGLEDALALVAARGRMMQQLPSGAMTAVPLPEHDTRALLGDRLSLAAINGPSRCVVAGPFDAIEALEHKLAERGVECRRLHTSHAFHSAMLDPIVEPFAELVQQVPLSAPSIPFVSNVTGTWIRDEEATDPHYWARHLRQAVRFADGIRELLHEPQRVLLEVGPGQTLTTLARQHPDKTSAQMVLPSLRHPQEQRSDLACMLQALGQLWLGGIALDWPRLYPRDRPRRVALPTYPFERQRYWINPPDPAAVQGRSGALLKRPDIADWFYLPSWKRSLPPLRPPDSAVEQATWLIFGDTCGLGAQLARQLEQEGRTVVVVTAGEQWRRLDERAYSIRPAERADYEALIEDLRAGSMLPQAIVHLWNVTPPEPAAQSHDLSFYSLLFLAQALGALSQPISLAVVSNNMHSVVGEAALEPEKALLLGPCKVIPQEYPNVVCRSLDIILPAPGPQADELVEQIIAEVATPSTDLAIAYRGYDRWAQAYEAVRLPAAIGGKTRLRPGGVYLITGGLGGIGLVLAEELARSAQAKLVLTGRSAFPARAEWDAWLAAHGEQDPVGEKIRAVRRLVQLGAQVLVARADAADAAQMRAAIEAARRRFGPIHGVIHSAGIAGGGMIQLKTPEQAERVITPKVRAVQVLDALFADAELDFLVLCSSTIAVVGGIGQVDYCAANSFMDAYAHHNAARRGVFTVSINWDAWQEVGMAVNSAAAYGLGSPGAGQSEVTPLAHARPIAHPLLHSYGQVEHEAIYRTEFSPTADWVLAEHKIAGRPTLPGTAYLEMVRAAFVDQAGPGAVELREVLFLTPLMLQDDERKEVRTILTQEGDAVTFRVVSAAGAAGGQPAWQEHTRGSVRHLAAAPPRQHDLAELIGRCNVAEQAIGAKAMEGLEKFVYWGPRWHSITKIYLGVDQGLAAMELPEQFAADLDGFWLHPAMLDVATAFGTGFVGEGSNYLPLSYRKLTVHSPFTRNIYSYARYRDAAAANKETISFDITIIDERGQELATIEEFTLKRVHGAALKPREQPGARGTTKSVIGISSREGVEAFNRIMARTRLPQVVVSTKDLHATIQRAGTIAKSRLVEQLDKAQAARAIHPRPDVQTAYAAPTNAVEQRLAEVWQSILGIEQVGIHDNFFELGGDSVLAIQIIARCGSAGLQVTPAQLFQHQTVADLAAVVEAAPATQQERASIDGPAPLTPLQHWMLDQDSAAPQRWARVFSLRARGRLDGALLEAALRHLIAHHDALRLRLTGDDFGLAADDRRGRAAAGLRLHRSGGGAGERAGAGHPLASR